MTAKIKPNTQIIGQNLVYFARLDSTNHLAMEMYKHQLIENGTVIYTDEQTNGRGQLQREWQSAPYENLLFSLLLQPVTNTITNPFTLNKCIALALCLSLKDQFPNENVSIKWPNDLMINNKKIAGILIENTIQGIFLKNSIIGIGINVNQTDFEEMNKIISMQLTTGNELQRDDFFKDILLHIEQYFMLLKSKKLERLKSEYLMNLYNYQKTAFYKKGDLLFEGKIIDVEQSGLLVMELFENNAMRKIEKFMFKEIEFLR